VKIEENYDLSDQEYKRFTVVIQTVNSGNLSNQLEIVFNIYDKENPVNGDIQLSLNGETVNEDIIVNRGKLYIKIFGGYDQTNKYSYEYRLILNGIEGKWEKLLEENKFVLILTIPVSHNLWDIKVQYRVKDSVGNLSQNKYSNQMRIDLENPTIELNKNNETVENGSIINGETVNVMFKDNSGKLHVKGYLNNKLIVDKEYLSNNIEVNTIVGHYKYIVEDEAGNKNQVEFIILDKENKYTFVNNNKLDDIDNAEELEIKFDKVLLQEVHSNNYNVAFTSDINVDYEDSVYIIGVVPNKEGRMFSILKESVTGEVFEHNKDNFSLEFDGLDDNYEIKDYLMDYLGKQYVLIGVIDNQVAEQPQEESQEQQEERNMIWIICSLGAVVMLVGGMFIFKFKRRTISI